MQTTIVRSRTSADKTKHLRALSTDIGRSKIIARDRGLVICSKLKLSCLTGRGILFHLESKMFSSLSSRHFSTTYVNMGLVVAGAKAAAEATTAAKQKAVFIFILLFESDVSQDTHYW